MPSPKTSVSPKPASPAPAPGTLARGVWGRRDAQARVEETEVRVEYACASGSFPAPVKLDAKGHFEVDGLYVVESGAVPTQPPQPVKARYRGAVVGDKLSLSVERNGEWLPPAELTFGEDVVISKCMSARPMGLE